MMAETRERNGGETRKLRFMTREYACLLKKPSMTQESSHAHNE